jgi:hypothetical protein
MVVMSLLILTFVMFRFIAPGPWLVLAIGSMILLISRSYIFIQFSLRVDPLLLLLTFILLNLPPSALLSGIIIYVTCVGLIYPLLFLVFLGRLLVIPPSLV